MTHFTLYILMILDGVRVAFAMGLAGIAVMTLVFLILKLVVADGPNSTSVEAKAEQSSLTRCVRTLLIVFACLTFALAFVPSTKRGLVIYAVPAIAQNEAVQDLPVNALRLLNQKIESMLDETTEEPAQ